MCGIVGLFLKDKALEPKLLSLLPAFSRERIEERRHVLSKDGAPEKLAGQLALAEVAELIPDIALTVQSPKPDRDFRGLDAELAKAIGAPVSVAVKSTHAVIRTTPDKVDAAREVLQTLRPDIRIMGAGEAVEIYKEVGLPEAVVERFGLRAMTGTHGI
ncbi:MAG: glutamine amidotransferase, partial [Mesorhizobium sp.]